jgi:hypothetical protein
MWTLNQTQAFLAPIATPAAPAIVLATLRGQCPDRNPPMAGTDWGWGVWHGNGDGWGAGFYNDPDYI